jgi:beta-carotene 3-hydroxylase
MEFMAWFTHKYIMHGFLWVLHRDHHRKDHDSWFERNDAFFIFYAVVSMSFFYLGATSFWQGYAIGFGILAYGITYFLVHDIFIHQRFKIFRNANNWYARGVRRAHKIHHKHLGKEDGECFGMLFVPFKYFKKK